MIQGRNGPQVGALGGTLEWEIVDVGKSLSLAVHWIENPSGSLFTRIKSAGSEGISKVLPERQVAPSFDAEHALGTPSGRPSILPWPDKIVGSPQTPGRPAGGCPPISPWGGKIVGSPQSPGGRAGG